MAFALYILRSHWKLSGEQVLGFPCVVGIAKAKGRSRVSNQDVTAITEAAVARLGLQQGRWRKWGDFRESRSRTGWCTDCGEKQKAASRLLAKGAGRLQ